MGSCCSSETGGLASNAGKDAFDIRSLNLVQIKHKHTGHLIVCGTPSVV